VSFEKQFNEWLEEGLKNSIPDSVKAFYFYLFEYPETAEFRFGIGLIGASTFDEDDDDWACDEVWEMPIREIDIPISYSGLDWEECLLKAKALINGCLNKMPDNGLLKSRLAIGVGFVSGDVEVIWKP